MSNFEQFEESFLQLDTPYLQTDQSGWPVLETRKLTTQVQQMAWCTKLGVISFSFWMGC